METKRIIKQIVTNPYIGFVLLIKDVFEIINGFVNNLNINEIMDYTLIVNMVINLFIAIVIYNLLTLYKKTKREKLQRKINDKYFELSIVMHNLMIKSIADAFSKQVIENKASENLNNDNIFLYVTHLKEYERKYLGISKNNATGTDINNEAIRTFNCKNIPDLSVLSKKFTQDERLQLGFTNKEIELMDYESNNSK